MADDPFPARTPCLFEGCRLSVEEHHRLNRGLIKEVADLRQKLRAPEEPNLSEVPIRDLLDEIERRLGVKLRETQCVHSAESVV